MLRGTFVLAFAAVALAFPLASCGSVGRDSGRTVTPTPTASATPSAARTAAEEPGTLTLRLRFRAGAWKKSLYLRLVKTQLSTFTVCAIRNWQATDPFDCAGAGAKLPEQTSLRLEQNPVARSLKRSDSPGWGMLGSSATSTLGAAVSNSLTGDRFGAFHYRVTLREASGRVLATSNKVTVVWHR